MNMENISNTNEQQTQYAKKPIRKERKKDSTIKIRNFLNIAFMLLAVIGVAVYLWGNTFIGTIIVLVSMAIKMVECVMRILR